MLKIVYANRLGLSPAISSQLTLEISAAAKNCEKFAQTPFFKVIGVDKSKKAVTSTCCDKQHVCIYPQPFLR